MRRMIAYMAVAALFCALAAGAANGTFNQSGMTIRFGAAEGAAGYECRTDGSAWRTCSSPVVYPDGTFGNGPHVFEVRTIGPDGRRSESVSTSWIVKLVAPKIVVAKFVAFSGVQGFAFPSGQVKKLGPSCVGSKPRVKMVNGGYGFRTVACKVGDTTYRYSINAKGHVLKGEA